MGNSLVVQWLELRAFTAEGVGLIRAWGTKIPQAMRYGQKKIKKRVKMVDFLVKSTTMKKNKRVKKRKSWVQTACCLMLSVQET